MRDAYLHTRLGIFVGRLLDDAALRFLLQADHDGGTAWSRLAPPHEFTNPAHENFPWRGVIEDFTVLIRPLSTQARAFFIAWLRKHEVTNFKAIVRGRLARVTNAALRAGLMDLGPYATLPLDALLQAEDSAEMLRILETDGTYAAEAGYARQVYEQRQATFVLEAALDFRYYRGILRRVRELDGEGELTQLIRIWCERVNLIWLLRYRFVYALSPAETYYWLIPATGHHWVGADFLTLARRDDAEQVIAALSTPIRERLAEASTITEMEQRLEAMVRERAWRVVKSTRNSLARVFAYLLLRECEVNRLLAIAKGKALGLPPATVRTGLGFSGDWANEVGV